MNPTPDVLKSNVLAFYDALINRKSYAEARNFVGLRYIQHNPLWPDDFVGLEALVRMLREKYPAARSEIKRAFVVDDHVILHVHSRREPDSPGRAIVDIFRMEEGKIAEHWDVIQEIPATSSNGNGMF